MVALRYPAPSHIRDHVKQMTVITAWLVGADRETIFEDNAETVLIFVLE